jgi:hypothetical protein
VVAATGDRSVESRLLALEQRLATLEAMALARPVLRTLVSENR